MEAALSLLALALVAAGAVIHAAWNLLIKRSGGGVPFVWAYAAASALIYLPVAVWAVASGQGAWSRWAPLFILASGLIHIGYALLLQSGYRRAGLSVVYPVARGVGPALSVVGAVALLGERPSWPLAIGATLVVAGVLIIGLARPADGRDSIWNGIGWGGMVGLCIAAYTLNDGAAVRLFDVSPIVLDYFANLVRLIAMAPLVLRDRPGLAREFRRAPKTILAVGAMIPIPYIMALYAMRLAPVSLVAPARELSMLVGVVFAWRVLGEQDMLHRFVGAALILAGVATLSSG